MDLRSAGFSVEIPIWFDGQQKWLTGLTRRTTCDDIIYALLSTERREELENAHTYAIYERWRDVERPLQGRTKILKVWKAWGAEQKSVKLQLQKFEDLHYSVEWVKTRRRHPRRSRSRSSSSKGSICKCPHCASKEKSNLHKSRSVESLMETVMSQEEQIQSLFQRIQDTDRLIESYETRLHHHRVKYNGQNYVQDAYLESLSEDSVEELTAGMDPIALEQYLHICDSIIDLEDRIMEEREKIQNLSVTLKQGTSNQPVVSSGYMDCSPNIVGRKDHLNFTEVRPKNLSSGGNTYRCLQIEINRSTALNLEQGILLENLGKEIRCCNQEWQEKKALLESLLADFNVTRYVPSQATVIENHQPNSNQSSRERQWSNNNHWSYQDINNSSTVTTIHSNEKYYHPPIVPGNKLQQITSCRQENFHKFKQNGLSTDNRLYASNKQDDNDSDTGLSSMHSDESATALETLV